MSVETQAPNVSPASSESTPRSTEAALLDGLYDTMERAPAESTEVVAAAYDVARHIGEQELGVTEPVKRLLADTAADARPAVMQYEPQLPVGAGADYEERARVLRFTDSGSQGYAARLRLAAQRKGIELKQEDDPELLAKLKVISHEGGHALMGGVGVALRDKLQMEPTVSLATGVVLTQHPEQGCTGHWETDRDIADERFAEGYQKVVMEAALKARGYSPQEADLFLSTLEINHRAFGPAGTHQVDVLGQVTKDKGPAELLDNPDYGQDNPGILGYNLPYTKQEIIEQLEMLAHAVYDQDSSQIATTPEGREEWYRAVHRKQARNIKRELDKAIKDRRGELKKMRHEGQAPDKRRRAVAHGAGPLATLRAVAGRAKRR